MIARMVNLLLGLTLAGTAFWEPRGSTVFWHDLVLGLVVAGVAPVAMAARGARGAARLRGPRLDGVHG